MAGAALDIPGYRNGDALWIGFVRETLPISSFGDAYKSYYTNFLKFDPTLFP